MHWLPVILILAWVHILAAYGIVHWRARLDPPKHLSGWWHGLQPGPRWTPKAWYDACQCSLERSKERRNDSHDHRS